MKKLSGLFTTKKTSDKFFIKDKNLYVYEPLTDKNFEELCAIFKENKKITHLDLTKISINEALIKRIILSLKENEQIESVVINPEKINSNLIEDLNEACAFNVLSNLLDDVLKTGILVPTKTQINILTHKIQPQNQEPLQKKSSSSKTLAKEEEHQKKSDTAANLLSKYLSLLKSYALSFVDKRLFYDDFGYRIKPIFLDKLFPFLTKNIESLDFSKNSLCKEIKNPVFIEKINTLINLKKLNLSSNSLDDDGLLFFLEGIPNLKNLHLLDISDNKLEFKKVKLSNALEKNKELECLLVSKNPIKDNFSNLFCGLSPKIKIIEIVNSQPKSLASIISFLSQLETILDSQEQMEVKNNSIEDSSQERSQTISVSLKNNNLKILKKQEEEVLIDFLNQTKLQVDLCSNPELKIDSEKVTNKNITLKEIPPKKTTPDDLKINPIEKTEDQIEQEKKREELHKKIWSMYEEERKKFFSKFTPSNELSKKDPSRRFSMFYPRDFTPNIRRTSVSVESEQKEQKKCEPLKNQETQKTSTFSVN